MKYKHYPKRDAIKNYFPLPNEIFCLGLSTGEIAVYAYLMYCEDRKTFQCHPNYHDGCQVKLQLCCGCFDRVLDMVVPLCRTTPITDLVHWKWPDEEKTADIMESRRKSRGRKRPPSLFTSDGRADRLGLFIGVVNTNLCYLSERRHYE